MKATGLEKLKASKISGQMHQAGTPGRFGKNAADASARREQRKLDHAQGLVPLAVKLDGELLKRFQALAQERQAGINEVVAELLKKGLGG